MTVDLDIDQRLPLPLTGLDDARHLAVALHRDDPAVHDMDGEAAPVQLHPHRIDQERHIVLDNLDHGVATVPAVTLQVGVEDIV